MASGIESLLEALKNSGVITDGIDGTTKRPGTPGQTTGTGTGGGKKSSTVVEVSFLDNMPSSRRGWIILFVVAALVILAAYWWFHPPLSLNSTELWMPVGTICLVIAFFFYARRTAYMKGIGKFEKSPSNAKKCTIGVLLPLVVVACGLVGAVLSLSIIPGNAEKYASVLQTDTLDFAQDIPEVNYSEIPVIDRASAELIGDREMGSIPEYVSQFEISPLYSQINYKGTPVRVSPLNYADLFKWFMNRNEGLPAYSLVNMTTQDAEIVRLEDNPIYYSRSEPLERNIDRFVQLQYPTYIFDEKSFEIDEDGQPWWICPVRTFTIGLFGGYTIDRVILCNATTGECTEMAVSDVPEWVDRVFPAELLIEQYNWYGAYHNGWLNSFLGQEGVVRTTPGADGALGYNYIAKDDDVWVYTGVTSATADNSIVGFVLVNQRTQASHFYSVAGATEDSAQNSAEGQVQNLRYTATFPLLINVANQPTYFMALKDGSGLPKKFAMIDIQRYQNVAVGDTVADTQVAYKELLARNGVMTDSSADVSDVKEVTGVISSIAQAVIDGNTHFYLMIEGEDMLFDFPLPGLVNVVRYKVGDTITFSYLPSENMSPVYSLTGPDGKKQQTTSGENNNQEQAVDQAAAEQAAAGQAA